MCFDRSSQYKKSKGKNKIKKQPTSESSEVDGSTLVGETSWSVMPGVMKTGAYRYEDGTNYVGDWNPRGQKHGMGHMALPDGTRYDGAFQNGLCSGLGIMCFPDGAK
uniref:Uncharacterized protein n=1 Tax=Timema douglasi TaxID=61478 RepID=A0A7R8VZV9_TIMDO|nr:unnamed protein product [Timema douglasi]